MTSFAKFPSRRENKKLTRPTQPMNQSVPLDGIRYMPAHPRRPLKTPGLARLEAEKKQ